VVGHQLPQPFGQSISLRQEHPGLDRRGQGIPVQVNAGIQVLNDRSRIAQRGTNFAGGTANADDRGLNNPEIESGARPFRH